MKRYSIEARTETTTVLTESTGGDWVRVSEYLALEAERDQLREDLTELEAKYAASQLAVLALSDLVDGEE